MMKISKLSQLQLIFKFNTQQENIIKTSRFIKLKNKKNEQLSALKKQLALKKPNTSLAITNKQQFTQQQSIYKQYHHRQIYKMIDTNIQSFFHKRQYNIQNFNFLINLIGIQNKISQIDPILEKMRLLKIYPNDKTYTYIIKAYSLHGNVNLAEKYFKQVSQKFLPNKYTYNTLIQCYTINNNPQMAIAILRQMKQKGISPDIPVYTTVINSFRIGRKLQKCWQLNKQVRQSNLQIDETYVGVMLKVYAATHDAQKAIKMYTQNILQKGIQPMLQTKNSYFKVLASRKQYVDRVIDSFFDMVQQGQIINNQTVRWALKACATKASIKDAGQILKIARLKQIEINKPIYNCLLRIYASSCSQPMITQQGRQVIIADSWKLLEQIKAKNMLDVTILNNMLQVYSNSLKDQEIQGLILPLYEKNQIPYNIYTYEFLMEMFYKKSDFTKVMRIYEMMKLDNEDKLQRFSQTKSSLQINRQKKNQQYRETFKICDILLQVGIKMLNMRTVLNALDLYKKMGRMPKNSTLKFLANLQGVPQEIIASLMDFKIKFGKARAAKKGTNIQDPQNI